MFLLNHQFHISLMNYPVLFLLLFLPSALIGQILKESSTVVEDFGTERYEQLHYVLRQYEIVDSTKMIQLKNVLMPEGSQALPKQWNYMMFVDQVQDTTKMDVTLQPLPYKLHGLLGFFQIDSVNVLVYNEMPIFLKVTKSSKSFSYVRHTYKVDDENWIEFSGDDCSHSWKLFFINNKFFSY